MSGGESSGSGSKSRLDSQIRNNHLIHLLYVRNDFDKCLEVIDAQLSESRDASEYALFVKALILRQRGRINESLELFRQAALLNPRNINNLKQIGRNLVLLGKFRQALEVYEDAQRLIKNDWEVWHNKGMCYTQMKQYEKAEKAFQRAKILQKNDNTFMQLGRVYMLKEDYDLAIETYIEALDSSPENSELLTTLGLLYLRKGENDKAFRYLGTALTLDPKNTRTIMAAGSVIQDHSEMDTALAKYRVAAHVNPNSAQLWNNIGMCFFGKQNFVAAIACLKRALYLSPFEWLISYNLGLAHLNTKQYASAFHFLSTCINLNSEFPSAYVYLGMTLGKLDDFPNACSAYEKALQMDADDSLAHLNYAVMLANHGNKELSSRHAQLFDKLYAEEEEAAPDVEADVTKTRKLLDAALKS